MTSKVAVKIARIALTETAHLAAQNMAKQFWPERLEIRESLPKTETGKVQKFVLREQLR